jgi:hypothetical protein
VMHCAIDADGRDDIVTSGCMASLVHVLRSCSPDSATALFAAGM